MLDVLPVELRLNIAEHTAQLLVYEDRPVVLQLALISRSIARVVRPILYQCVIVTHNNLHHFILLGSCDDILKLARRMTVCTQPDGTHRHTMAKDKVMTVLERWNPPPGGSHLNIPWNFLHDVITSPLGKQLNIRGIDIRFMAIQGALVGYKRVPPDITRQLTHVTGYIPTLRASGTLSDTHNPDDTPGGWAHMIVSALPALTHLGLYLVDVNERNPNDQSNEDFEINCQMLHALRELNQGLHICIRVGGVYLKRRAAVEELIGSLSGPLLTVWYDVKPILTWSEEEAREVDDAWRGRTIWSGAAQLPADDLR